MKIQDTIFGSHEVVVRYKPQGEEAYNKPLFEGTLEECKAFIKTCQINREGDK
jgi:hypothetical protein